MAGKRSAASDLNHENWDKEEEKEAAGTFQVANREEIERRVIKKAVRRTRTVVDSSASKMNENGNASHQIAPKSKGFIFLPDSTVTTLKPFSFLSKDHDGTENLSKPALFSFLGNLQSDSSSTDTFYTDKSADINSGVINITTSCSATLDTSKAKLTTKMDPKAVDLPSATARSETFLTGMREINEDFVNWISNHIEKQPTVILTRCFKDYISHVQKLFDDEKKLPLTDEQRQLLEKQESVLNELIAPGDAPKSDLN